MLKKLSGLLCIAIIAVSCLKNKNASCPYTEVSVHVPQTELDSIEAYLDSNHIDATLDNAGFYYEIVTPGAGQTPVKLCSQIVIAYKGTLKTGEVFDQNANAYFVLGSLILGWQKGIPLINSGGEIKLYIPPALGYGDNEIKNDTGKVVIPKKSMLIFDVKLLDHD